MSVDRRGGGGFGGSDTPEFHGDLSPGAQYELEADLADCHPVPVSARWAEGRDPETYRHMRCGAAGVALMLAQDWEGYACADCPQAAGLVLVKDHDPLTVTRAEVARARRMSGNATRRRRRQEER